LFYNFYGKYQSVEREESDMIFYIYRFGIQWFDFYF
jgi:hypothetical protein